MPREKSKPRLAFALPEIEVGDWHGEFAGSPSGKIGQHIYNRGRRSWSWSLPTYFSERWSFRRSVNSTGQH